MPNLYNHYCYPNLKSITDSIVSEPVVFITGKNPVYSTLVSSSGDSAVFSTSVGNYSRTFPVCTNVGYLTNYSGLDLVDVTVTSWLVVLVWVLAWGIKQMRRAL